MNMNAIAALSLACCCSLVQADPYYTGNPLSPYPPGCITAPLQQLDLEGENVARFWGGSIWLEVASKVQSPDANRNQGLVYADMYRVGCAEPNRSVILIEFELPREWVDPRNAQIMLPSAGGGWDWYPVPFELRAEANGWGQSIQQAAVTKQAIGDYTGGWNNPRLFTWRYVLDVGPVGEFWTSEFLTEYYNSRFWLDLYRSDPLRPAVGVVVPATRDVLEPNAALPLNGRLTGTWVEPGAADQGFLLTFSNPVPPAGSAAAEPENSELLVFLSWYTFDAEGRQLWLVGNARFPQGATEVTVPIVQVANGQFLGSQAAERNIVGQLRLAAKRCDALEVDYDLAELELGAGAMRLQRIGAMEIAGYTCRDYLARLASLPMPAGN